MMLDRLGERRWIAALSEGAVMIDDAVKDDFATRALRPIEFGGDHGLKPAAKAIAHALSVRARGRGWCL
jgi:3-isopropylmalate dehydrogenase